MARAAAQQVVIVAAKRTPFGAFGGALKELSATDLGVAAARAALAQVGARGDEVDQVVFGNVAQTSSDAIYLARHVGLRAGLPEAVPALTVNRLCGSGFQAVISAAEEILLGEADVVLCGGAESMSQSPHVVRGARWGLPLGKAPPFEDALWAGLTDGYVGLPMALTAENLAERHGLSRAACDAYALRSQRAFAAAAREGRLAAELAPLTIPGRKGEVTIAADEHPRADTTAEGLARLPTVFKKDGVVTAGNASGICDGAAALLVCSREAAERRGWSPLARLAGWAVVGCDPRVMGIGPVPAVRRLLDRTGRRLGDFDLIDVNEAFAPQVLAVARELELPPERLNVDGGAIAVGHPLAASGARITGHLAHELARRGGGRALGSACIGGGQGIALALEAIA